jgi:catechol 2,3-dioxygenase-like lactoylglutathione lyase family enzyme
MKDLALLSMLLLLPACTTMNAAPSDPETSKQTVFAYPHVKRPNLLVADLDRSLEIYRDIIGFETAPIGTSALDSYSYPVFKIPPEGRMRYAYLGEAGEDRVFALTEVSNVDLPRPPDGPHMSTVVIGVTGLEAIIEKLKALDLEMTEPRVSGGADFTFTEVSFVDPDGHMIVLYEVQG